MFKDKCKFDLGREQTAKTLAVKLEFRRGHGFHAIDTSTSNSMQRTEREVNGFLAESAASYVAHVDVHVPY